MRASIVRRGRHSVGSPNPSSRRWLWFFGRALLVGAGLASLTPAIAGDTPTYTYDARGRLIQVTHSGTAPNNGVTATYTFDKADNRQNVSVTIAPPACSGVTFTVASNGAVTEGASSVFTVTKAGTATGSCSVNYATANNTAIAPGDYNAASGTLTFTTAQTSQTVSVTTIDDTTIESAETFNLNLSSPTSGAALGTPSSAAATINDNDTGGVCAGVSFAVSDASVTEGSPLVFTVTKTGSTSSSCSVSYATADGTAVAPTHYTAKSGTLTFTSAQTSQTVSVTTIDNNRLNLTLLMYLNLSGATGGAAISDSQGVGSIGASGGGGGGCRTCLLTAPISDPLTPEHSPSAVE